MSLLEPASTRIMSILFFYAPVVVADGDCLLSICFVFLFLRFCELHSYHERSNQDTSGEGERWIKGERERERERRRAREREREKERERERERKKERVGKRGKAEFWRA